MVIVYIRFLQGGQSIYMHHNIALLGNQWCDTWLVSGVL